MSNVFAMIQIKMHVFYGHHDDSVLYLEDDIVIIVTISVAIKSIDSSRHIRIILNRYHYLTAGHYHKINMADPASNMDHLDDGLHHVGDAADANGSLMANSVLLPWPEP